MFRKILTRKVSHEVHCQILISNVENQVGSSLVNSFGDVGLSEKVINLISISSIMLVDQVKWIPFPMVPNIVGLRLSKRVKSLIQKIVDIKMEILSETFSGHVFATITEELNFLRGEFFQGLHDFGALEVSLSRVG